MGSRLSFDRKPSELSNLININIEGAKLMREQQSPPDAVHHHISIWRVLQTGQGVVCEPVAMESEDVADIQFISTEAYIILVVTRLPESKCKEPLPVFFWAALQSMDSITQESANNPLYSLTSEKFCCDLHVLKGKWLRPVVSVRAMGLAFELESTLRRGGQHLQGLLFNGIHVQKNRLNKSELFLLQKDPIAIPFGEALLSQLSKRGVSILNRLFPNPDKPERQNVLKFDKMVDKRKLFTPKPTTFQKVNKEERRPVVNLIVPKEKTNKILEKPSEPKDQHPFLVEISKIGEDTDAFVPQPVHSAQDLNMDDFERELEESLAYRRNHQTEEDEVLQQHEQQHELEEPPNYSDQSLVQVTKGLFISGEKAAYSLEELQKNSITLVINVAADYCNNRFPGQVEYLSYFCKDSQKENIESLFYPCIEKIQEHIENKGGALVHCVRGVSRSASIILAYLILTRKMSYQDAEKLLRTKRPQASPNNGFMLQLINFDRRVNSRYEGQPFRPKVFGIGSYQQESPKQLVAKHISDKMFKSATNGLDPRGVFVIQHQLVMYVWRGSKCQFMSLYMETAMKHVQYLIKYESAVNNIVTINEGNEPAAFWTVLELPGKPVGSFSNSLMLYLSMDAKHVPRGICNPQILVFRLGSTIPLPHRKLSEDNFYLQCKEDRTGVRFIMWPGRKWKVDESAQATFLRDIRDLYYSEWDDNEIMLHTRQYEFSESSIIVEKDK